MEFGCPTWTRTKRMPASEAGALPIWLLGISNNNYYNRNIVGVKLYFKYKGKINYRPVGIFLSFSISFIVLEVVSSILYPNKPTTSISSSSLEDSISIYGKGQ